MSVWSRLFGKNDAAMETDEQVTAFIAELRQMAIQDVDNARKLVKNQCKSQFFQKSVRIGGQYHDQFKAAVAPVLFRDDPGGNLSDLPTVLTMPWEQVENLNSIFLVARSMKEQILYLVPSRPEYDADALMQLEAIHKLASEPGMVMVTGNIDDRWLGPLFMRKSFLEEASQSLNPEYEEVIEELAEYARKQEYKVENC